LLLTGSLFAPLLSGLVDRHFSGPGMPEVRVQACTNELFGPTVTVAGLLSGDDLLRGAWAAGGGWDLVIVPRQAFRAAGDLTLDDRSLRSFEERLGCKVAAAGSAGELADLVLGMDSSNGGPLP